MRAKGPTIGDIARLAGISKGAVSYALNGRPGVSADTRQRVVAIAEEIGWRPNSAARALSGAAAQAVGMGLCRPARVLGVEPFFMELISGIEAVLSAQSFGLVLQVVPDHAAEIELYRRWSGERRVDGVIVVDLSIEDVRVPVLEELGLPAVVIGGPQGVGSLAHVRSDDGAAIRESVSHLAALGHRRILRVSGPAQFRHTAVRDAAFVEVCAQLGLHGPEPRRTDYTGEQSAVVTRTLLAEPDRPTAVLYDNDVMALAGLGVAHEMGLRVPDDLSIVAWDDSALSQLVHPPLTAVGRDIHTYGVNAARQLLGVLAGEPLLGLQDQSAQLRPRGSTAAPPAGS